MILIFIITVIFFIGVKLMGDCALKQKTSYCSVTPDGFELDVWEFLNSLSTQVLIIFAFICFGTLIMLFLFMLEQKIRAVLPSWCMWYYQDKDNKNDSNLLKLTPKVLFNQDCAVCWDRRTRTYILVAGSCGHVYCGGCFLSMIDFLGTLPIPCPSCRSPCRRVYVIQGPSKAQFYENEEFEQIRTRTQKTVLIYNYFAWSYFQVWDTVEIIYERGVKMLRWLQLLARPLQFLVRCNAVMAPALGLVYLAATIFKVPQPYFGYIAVVEDVLMSLYFIQNGVDLYFGERANQ